jgi:hypothetical protein
MFATYFNSLHESMSRRVAWVLFGVALLVAVLFNAFVHVHKVPGEGNSVVIGSQLAVPVEIGVPALLESEIRVTGTLWLLLGIFAAAPLLVATLEKGWLELLFSKGTPRWRIFTGRFLGGLTLYALIFAVASWPLAARLWLVTGVPTWRIAAALGIQTLSFAALLSVAALVTLPQRGVALPIIASVGLWVLAPVLASRERTLYHIISSHTGRAIIDWAYRILPKTSEIEDACVQFVQGAKVATWWPLWSTAIFAGFFFALTLWQLSRKSF